MRVVFQYNLTLKKCAVTIEIDKVTAKTGMASVPAAAVMIGSAACEIPQSAQPRVCVKNQRGRFSVKPLPGETQTIRRFVIVYRQLSCVGDAGFGVGYFDLHAVCGYFGRLIVRIKHHLVFCGNNYILLFHLFNYIILFY